MSYRVENGIIRTEKGLPCLPRWFAEERVAFEVGKSGISRIDYWNKTTDGNCILFSPIFGAE